MADRAQTLARALAGWAHGVRLDALPEQVAVATQKALLNTVGTAVGAVGLEDVERALAIASPPGETGPSGVFVDGARLPTMSALLVNAVMVNTLGQEETHVATGMHASETTVPAVLAVAELRRISGQEVLEAVLVGIETTIAFASMSLTPPVKFDNCEAAAAYGAVGAAAAAGRAMRLDEEALANAIALGANFAGGLSECVRVGTSEYHFSVAKASTNGYLAALLAESGKKAAPTSLEGEGGFYQLFAAVPRDVLTGHPVTDDVLGTIAERWGVLDLIYKPYPVNFFNQTFVDGAIALRRALADDAQRISAIRLTVNPFAEASGGLNRGPFDSRESVLGSTPFCVASMLSRGTLSLADTLDFRAPDIVRLVELTSVSPSRDLGAARIEVDAGDRTLAYDAASEGRDYRLSFDEVAEIVRGVVTKALSAGLATRIEDGVRGLCDATDGGKLVDLLTGPAARPPS